MNIAKNNKLTAFFLLAVIFIGLATVGCVTKRDMQAVQNRLTTVEGQNNEIKDMVSKMDSIIATGGESNNALRVDIRTSIDQISQQISQLLENYNDLIVKVDQLNRQPQVIRKSPISSGGAQPETGRTTQQTPDVPPAKDMSADCIAAYDDAFIKARKTEYENAVEAFRSFLETCPDHENVANARYWIGECYYAMEQFEKAVEEFSLVMKDHSSSRKMPSAIYKTGRCKQELGKNKDAKELFNRVIDEYSGTLEAEQAKERLKDLK